MTHFQALAKNLGIENKCKFFGQVSDGQKTKIYSLCRLVAVPSLWPEPFGRVVVEAMSFKKPVVGSSIGGITELIDEKVGVLVPPGDTRALADAIISILTNKMSFQFEFTQKRFSIDEVTRQYASVICQACQTC